MIITTDLVRAAATALASALPVPSTLSGGMPVPAAEVAEKAATLLPSQPGAAVVCRVGATPGSTATGELAVVVDGELVHALASSPLGSLDLASAVQPALDAAAHAVSGSAATAARQLEVELALTSLLVRPGAQLVPLVDPHGIVVATLLIALDESGVQGPEFEQAMPTVPAASVADVPLPRQAATASPARPAPAGRGGLDLLRDVAMEITVELGRTRMTVRELLSLTPGAVVELDRAAGSPADLLVNGTLIARGEVVVVDEDFGIRITEIVATGPEGSISSGIAGSSAPGAA